jgi:hypothetical protein
VAAAPVVVVEITVDVDVVVLAAGDDDVLPEAPDELFFLRMDAPAAAPSLPLLLLEDDKLRCCC